MVSVGRLDVRDEPEELGDAYVCLLVPAWRLLTSGAWACRLVTVLSNWNSRACQIAITRALPQASRCRASPGNTQRACGSHLLTRIPLCYATSSGYQVWGACVCRDSIRQGQCLGVCDHTNDDGGVTTRELGACCTAAADSLTRSGSHVPIACVATPVQTPESWIDIHTAAATAMAYAPQQRTLYGLLLTTSVCTARYEPDNERLATCGEDSRLNVLSLSNKPPLWTATEKAGCGFADVCFQSDCVLISAGYACMVTLLQPVCAITLVSQRTVPAVTPRASPHAQLKLWDIRKHKPEALFREYACAVWGSETGHGAPWLTLACVVAAVLQQAPCCTPSRPILWSSTLSRRAQVMAW